MSAANRLQRRSRKSPSLIVPPGNWREIFSVPACAQAPAAIPRAPAPATLPIPSRRVMAMGCLLMWFSIVAFWRPARGAAIGNLAKTAPDGRPWPGPPRLAGRAREQAGADMQNAIAFCDNDVVVVAWSYGHKVT